MKKILMMIALAAAATQLVGCGWVKEGRAGLRINYDNTIEREERPAGTLFWKVVGSTIQLPIRELSADVVDVLPQASDNSTMADFDATIVYSINPTQVAELYIDRNRSFHSRDEDGEIMLMHEYMKTVTKNAIFKVARLYPAMKMNDARTDIEQQIKEQITKTLKDEKLDNSVSVSQVMVKSMLPSLAVKASADRLVAAQADLQAKDTELQAANKEAQRIATLNANAQAIPYMNAQANMLIAEAVKAGKVNTIIIPTDFKGIVNAGNK